MKGIYDTMARLQNAAGMFCEEEANTLFLYYRFWRLKAYCFAFLHKKSIVGKVYGQGYIITTHVISLLGITTISIFFLYILFEKYICIVHVMFDIFDEFLDEWIWCIFHYDGLDCSITFNKIPILTLMRVWLGQRKSMRL